MKDTSIIVNFFMKVEKLAIHPVVINIIQRYNMQNIKNKILLKSIFVSQILCHLLVIPLSFIFKII